jgi:hypothetical protein
VTSPAMPQISFGPHSVSRLIVGANPINGGSHLSRFANLQMREFFTEEQILAFLRHCEEVGINTFQSSGGNAALLEKHREQGGTLQYISLFTQDDLERVVAARPIGIAYHGEETDSLFKQGKLGFVREQLKRARDTGVLIGVSTHMPDVIGVIEEQCWDLDFYMCCVYERHRTREELKRLLGHVPIPDREVYLREDPPRMLAMMRATSRPCLAFKILAAGRLCEAQETVEEAFRETLAGMKPNDGVILGMFPKYEDQAAINAEYVRKYAW